MKYAIIKSSPSDISLTLNKKCAFKARKIIFYTMQKILREELNNFCALIHF